MVQLAWKYSGWALESVIFPPCFLLFGGGLFGLVFAGWKQRHSIVAFWKPHHWLFLTHSLFFVLAILLGVLGEKPLSGEMRPEYLPQSYAEVGVQAIMWWSFASCAFWIWRMKGFRVFAASMMLLLEVPVLGAIFVAGMSITGDWV
jgi:hypothetical protein